MNRKLEIIYENGNISLKIKKACYEFFGIDIVDIFDDLFSFDKKQTIDYQDIRRSITTGEKVNMYRLMHPNYLKSIVVDDYKFKGDKLLYLDITVKEVYENKKYILYFDLDNWKLKLEEDEKTGSNNQYEYRIVKTEKVNKLFETQNIDNFQENHAILSKEIFKKANDDKTSLVKIHTNKGNRGINITSDNKEYSLFKYYFENANISSYITLKIENKQSIKSYTYEDFEKNETYDKKFMIQDIIDAYMTGIAIDDDIKSSLMLYANIKNKFQNIKDKFSYELEIKTRVKGIEGKSVMEEIITDNNGIISLSTMENIKKKVKNRS